jgi:hypothetical protein
MDLATVKRALCLADVAYSGLDRRPTNDDEGKPAKKRKDGIDLKAVVKAANAALKDAAKASSVDWSATASVDPSPRGPMIRVSWTYKGASGDVTDSAEMRLSDLVHQKAFA